MKKALFFMLLIATVAFCKNHARNSTNYERQYHSVIPLGAERIDLRPSKRTMFLLATAESPFFEGWHGPSDGHQLFASDGMRIESYPREIDLRLTATAMRPGLLLADSYATLNISDGAINDYILHLRSRMLIFHGLQVTTVEPEFVRLIGMPAEVNYDERVYLMRFTLPRKVPIEDRIVIEVLSPTGYRVCKFHLDLV